MSEGLRKTKINLKQLSRCYGWDSNLLCSEWNSEAIAPGPNIAHLQQQCHNSKFVIFQEKCLKFLKCY